MNKITNLGTEKLRREWKLDPFASPNPNKNYIPSHMREGFDESKIIRLPTTPEQCKDEN